MIDVFNIAEFNSLSPVQKHYFFDEQVNETVEKLDEKQLYKLLKPIILNSSENNYIRKKAVEVFTECVFLDKLKVWNELSILLQEWDENEDVSLEIRRLKDLFLFYNHAPDDIERAYQEKTENVEAEIAAESHYHLGLIAMQKAFLSDSRTKCIENLKESHLLFEKTSSLIENRIDADFFNTVITLILDFLNETHGGIKQKIETLARILLKQDLFSFASKQTYFHISFYRTLLNLNRVREKTEAASQWLYFRKDFNDLFYYYCEIKNSEIENRLNQSTLRYNFSEFIGSQVIAPFFAKSFPAELARINARLNEDDLSTEQREFLEYIKQLAENANLKKKSNEESVRQTLINIFPHRNHKYIETELAKVTDTTNWQSLFNVFNILAKPSVERFIDALIKSCLELQGNNIFKTASEDQRNTFLASLLDAFGSSTKDQTRWGVSNTGASPGEIDIFVRESDGTLFAIIEALNLDSLRKDYVKLHIDKIFKYDTSGLKQNFILVYSEASNFIGLWEKYIEYVSNHTYLYDFVKFEVISTYEVAELKIGRAKHIRNKENIFLYHLMLNLKQN